MPFPILAVMAIASAAASAAKGVQQSNLAKRINPRYNEYQTNDLAKKRLGLAEQVYGGRMTGASQFQDNIYGQQANAQANIERNATSGSQALSLAGAVQGQTNQSLGQLAQMESQDKMNRLGNLNNAYEGMIHEGDKEYNAMLMKYRDDVAAKTALRQASAQNWGNALNGAMSAVGGLTGGGGGIMGSVTGGAARQSPIAEIAPSGATSGYINTGMATNAMPMQMGATINPTGMGMLASGYNTNRLQGPARFNYMTGRWG
jgi:hypothetical protein